MSVKTRDLPIYDYICTLEREYFSSYIRSKISFRKSDKEYHREIMSRKEGKITTLASRNSIPCIFSDKSKYLDIWKEVIPTIGYPNFIYNEIVTTPKKKLTFPYSGTLLKVNGEAGVYVSERVTSDGDFVKAANLYDKDEIHLFPFDSVQRLSNEEGDRYMYYYPDNTFKVRVNGTISICRMISPPNFIDFTAEFREDGGFAFTHNLWETSRIL